MMTPQQDCQKHQLLGPPPEMCLMACVGNIKIAGPWPLILGVQQLFNDPLHILILTLLLALFL